MAAQQHYCHSTPQTRDLAEDYYSWPVDLGKPAAQVLTCPNSTGMSLAEIACKLQPCHADAVHHGICLLNGQLKVQARPPYSPSTGMAAQVAHLAVIFLLLQQPLGITSVSSSVPTVGIKVAGTSGTTRELCWRLPNICHHHG
jgi:hypothetical protein